MITSVRRSFAVVILIALPVVILWGLLLYFNPSRRVTEIPRTAPRWVEDRPNYGTCDNAMSGTPVTNQVGTIDSARAGRIGAGVVDTQTSFGSTMAADEPVLVQRTFADGQSRLAWLYAEGRVTDNIGMDAIAEIVYIDATTGEPLLLIKDFHTADPSFTCGFLNQIGDTRRTIREAKTLLMLAVGVILTVLYLGISFGGETVQKWLYRTQHVE